MIDWEPLAKALTDSLTADIDLDPQWQDAFTHTPRHHFVPRFWALDQFNTPADLVDGADPQQREQWLTACYSNQVLITQWHGQNGRRIVTSSASMPSIVAEMLQLLDVRDGHRVLEIRHRHRLQHRAVVPPGRCRQGRHGRHRPRPGRRGAEPAQAGWLPAGR